MRFGEIQGNADVLKALAGMVDSGRVPHAIMLSEQDGGGALEVAIAFLQYLYCQHRSGGDSCGVCPTCNKIGKLIHPDVHLVVPTKSKGYTESYMESIRSLYQSNPRFTENELLDAMDLDAKTVAIFVDETKALISTLSLSALEGGYRSVIMYLPERMNADSANKLLKLIEEPPEKTQFVLITHAPDKVLPTIASRCQRIPIKPEKASRKVTFDQPELLDDLMQTLIARDLYAALEVGERLAALPSRESAKAFCRYAADRMRDIFLIQQGMPEIALDPESVSGWAGTVKKTFPRFASAAIDRACQLIDRNVNLKILFTDLVDRLFFKI